MGLFSPEPQRHELEQMAHLALVLAARTTPSYTSLYSRKDFTQPQLLAILLLRAFLGETYRGVTRLLRASDSLRATLGLAKVPHWTTLERTANAAGMREVLDDLLTKLVAHVGGTERPLVAEAAIDSTGLESGVASGYYSKRTGKTSQFVKVSLAVALGWMIPCALVTSLGSSNDNTQAPELVRKMAANASVKVMYADAGYDGEPLHRLCREELGIESVIKPVPKARDGSIKTRYRALMTPLPDGYRRRAAVESVISAIKRTTGSRLRARSDESLRTEAAFKVVAYAVW
jgi:Transposase DDE domain